VRWQAGQTARRGLSGRAGRGHLHETLLGLLDDEVTGLRIVGLGQDLLDYDEETELAKVDRALTSPGGGDVAR
jgi:hypothetical protein